MSDPIQCPICMHEETLRARLDGREPCYDDAAQMRYHRTGGMRGQTLTRWDLGTWVCETCAAALSPRDAGVMLDATLMHVDPECDSIVDGMHADAMRAFRGDGR